MKEKRKIPAFLFTLIPVALTLFVLAGLTGVNFILNGNHTWEGGLSAARDFLDSEWNRVVYRQEKLSRLNTYYSYYTTGTLDNREVILGKDNWLFYSTTQDGAPLDDYQGLTTLTQEEWDKILEGVERVQHNMEVWGAEFVLILPPNKEQVYWEYMPMWYRRQPVSLVDNLTQALQEKGLNVVNPKAALMEAAQTQQVYYKYDTHWNQLGAYIGTRLALEKLGIPVEPLETQTIESQPLTPIRHYCAGEDLAQIVSMDWPYQDDLEYTVDGTVQPDWGAMSVTQENNGTYSVYENPEAPNQASVLLVGDSFRASMVPLLTREFSTVYVIKLANCTMNTIWNLEPDYVIWECVERRATLLEEGCRRLAGDEML